MHVRRAPSFAAFPSEAAKAHLFRRRALHNLGPTLQPDDFSTSSPNASPPTMRARFFERTLRNLPLLPRPHDIFSEIRENPFSLKNKGPRGVPFPRFPLHAVFSFIDEDIAIHYWYSEMHFLGSGFPDGGGENQSVILCYRAASSRHSSKHRFQRAATSGALEKHRSPSKRKPIGALRHARQPSIQSERRRP